MVTITRNFELEKLRRAKGWKLVYGRRKTGKSYLIENFAKWDSYFFVKRGGEIFDKARRKSLEYPAFVALLEELILNGKKAVIDEFHRLPKDFLDFLHIHSGKGEIILVSSTIWLSKRLAEKDSPILGLFSEVPVGLIDERDIITQLKGYSAPDLMILGAYLREPLMLRYLHEGKKAKEIIVDYFEGMKFLVPLLVSSVFQEEDKNFTQIYEGVVRAIASGKVNSKEITDFLFSRKLIPKAEHGYSQQYLANLIKIGLVKKTRIFNNRKFIYSNSSPMIDSYFYLDEKYNFSEEEIGRKQIEEFLDIIIPKNIEEFASNLLAKCMGLQRNRIISPSTEIDFALTRFKKLEVVGEVKWKKHISNKEIKEIEDKLSRFSCKKILVVPHKSVLERESKDITIISAEDMERMAKTSLKAL